MEKLKAWPWLASAWQNSMHLEAREEFTSSTAVILCLLLNYDFSEAEEEHAVFQCLAVNVVLPIQKKYERKQECENVVQMYQIHRVQLNSGVANLRCSTM